MTRMINAVRNFFRSEAGQDAFEYVLVIGVVVVAVLVAVATPVGDTIIDAVVTATCKAIDTLPYVSANLTC